MEEQEKKKRGRQKGECLGMGPITLKQRVVRSEIRDPAMKGLVQSKRKKKKAHSGGIRNCEMDICDNITYYPKDAWKKIP